MVRAACPTALASKLAEIVGAEHVSADQREVGPHLDDITEHPAGSAELVVRPGCTDHVAALLEAAHDLGVAVTPVIAGYNVAGIAIPHGGLVLDLRRLDGIEIDHDAMVVIVEPGVTFGQLKARLDADAPELAYTYPFAPPFTSVMANALLDGLNNLSLPQGAMGQWITGVEAVLADGTVVRTGSAAAVDSWFGRAPLPDLTGLFVSTQGTLGVVTRIGLKLVPKPACRLRWFAFAFDLESAHRAMVALARTGSVDDVGCMTWPAAKFLFGATRDLRRTEDEPLAFLFVDLTGSCPEELAAREGLVRRLLADSGVESVFEVADLLKLMPHLAKLADLPTTLDFLLDFPGGGLAWVGSYGPPGPWIAGAAAGMATLERHGFPPFLVARPMDGGHFHVLRFVACFDRGVPAEVARVRACMAELADLVLDHGYVPYKASADAATKIFARSHPGFVDLFGRVRDALDPDRRMNPGRWPEG